MRPLQALPSPCGTKRLANRSDLLAGLMGSSTLLDLGPIAADASQMLPDNAQGLEREVEFE